MSTIVAITAVLGLRIGDTLALRRSDIDFANPVIRIRQGIPRGGFHSMRHGAASSLLADGATPAVVQKQLRHSDPRITLGIYAHVVGNQQRDAVEHRAARIA